MTTTDSANGSRVFTATYHDTEERHLARAGIVLRRRMENGKSVWEVEVGNETRAADGGPAGPPQEILDLLAAPLLGRPLGDVEERGDLPVCQAPQVVEGNDSSLMVGQRLHPVPVVLRFLEHKDRRQRLAQPDRGGARCARRPVDV